MAAWVVDAVCADLDETLAGEALDGVSPSPDDEWRDFRRARVAATVLGRLGPSRRAAVQDEVLELAAAMEDPDLRRDVLSIAGDHLDAGGWDRAVALTEAEVDPYDRGILAGFLVDAAPAHLRPRLMAAALAEIDTLQVTPRVAATTRESRVRAAWAVARRIDELLSADTTPQRGEFKPTADVPLDLPNAEGSG